MKINLRKVTKDNWEECISLKVAKEQEGFVAPNLYSIAEVQFLPSFEALAIYDDETMVGFVMYGLDPDDNNYWIYRLMIDARFQGKGYGKLALLEVINNLRSKSDCTEIIVGYKPDNYGAAKVYAGVGFKSKGMAPWGEELVSYKVN